MEIRLDQTVSSQSDMSTLLEGRPCYGSFPLNRFLGKVSKVIYLKGQHLRVEYCIHQCFDERDQKWKPEPEGIPGYFEQFGSMLGGFSIVQDENGSIAVSTSMLTGSVTIYPTWKDLCRDGPEIPC